MTGTYPSFMATQDGRAILGRQPTLQDMLRSVAQGAPTSTGGYGGAPQGLGYPGGGQTFISGTGDRAMGNPGSPYFNLTFGQPALGGGGAAPAGPAIGGGGRGIALPPGTQTPSTPVPGQGVPTGAGGGVAAPGGALTVQQLLRQLGLAGGGTGGGGAGGAGGTAPGGIGAGQTAPESGERFAAANAAVNPSAMSALNIAGSVMSPLTGLPSQLLATAFPQLGNILPFGLGGGFNVKGPQLSPQQLNQLSQAYQQNPALAARLLATMRQQANIAGGSIGGGMLNRTGMTPMGSFGTTPQNELTANFTSPGFGLNPPATGFGGYATWGGPGGGFEGGGGLGGSPDTGGGLGGGVGNMGGGQNRSF